MKTRSKPPRLLMPLYIQWQQYSLARQRFISVAAVASVVAVVVMSAFINDSSALPIIFAKQVTVPTDRPFDCRSTGSHRIDKNVKVQTRLFEPKDPFVVQGFPATPQIGDGFLEVNRGDAILFQARSSKMPNGPILSTGSSIMFNGKSDEYRLLWVKAALNHTAVRKDEGVESDICVTAVPLSNQNSVSSGEELFCTHEHYFGGDDHSASGELLFDFGPGGFPLMPDTKLDVASVSKMYTSRFEEPLKQSEVVARDAPAKSVEISGLGKVTTSLDLLALNFKAMIVPSDADYIQGHAGLRSVRSPLRDRSTVPLPNSEILPLTEFTNAKTTPVIVRGLGIFRSMLRHYVVGDSVIRVLVDSKEVIRLCPGSHRPNESSSPFDEIVRFSSDIEILTGSTIRVEHNLVTHLPGQDKYKPTDFDLAVYILYEHPDFTSDALVASKEDKLGNGALDLNSDGFPEFVDYDVFGTLWADLTFPNGAHDTQHTTFIGLITKKGKFNKATTRWKWERRNFVQATVTDGNENWCFHLKYRPPVAVLQYLNYRTPIGFTFEYCDESAVPRRTLIGAWHRLSDFAIGDFDGDGHLDRLRIEPGLLKKKSLYFAKGDGSKYLWERKLATVMGECMMERPLLESMYMPSKQRHIVGYFSRCGFYEIDMTSIDFQFKNR